MENAEKIIKEISTGLWRWYNFIPESSVLYIADESEIDSLEFKVDDIKLSFATLDMIFQEKWYESHQKTFDYIIAIEILEKQSSPVEILKMWQNLLKPAGCLLLGMNNRLGIKYFCGDRDPYTERNFDSIENYRRAYVKKEDTFIGKMYAKNEIKNLLNKAGWKNLKFFSVLTDLRNPSLIFSEDYIPNEDFSPRVFPTYNHPDTVFLVEEILYNSLFENDMFHHMANAYLVECPLTENFSDVLQVTSSIDRGREDALFTIIHNDNKVEKRAVYPEGQKRLEFLSKNISEMQENGIKVVQGELKGNRYIMPYVNAEVGQLYLKKLLQEDEKSFLEKMDHFRDIILKSSEIVRNDPEDGVILRKGYFEMIPLNSFYVDGDFVFYDQEFCIENCPANFIIARMIASFYYNNNKSDGVHINFSEDELYERYGLLQDKSKWKNRELDFLATLRNEKELKKYHAQIRRNNLTVSANRQRLNFSTDEYQRVFIDIFKNADTRKLILFGSGRYTKRFIELYAMDYHIEAIIDNNSEHWGSELVGVKIQSPDILKDFQSGEYKVIICIKNYTSVIKQLEDMGILDYSIFDPNNNYPRKRKPIVTDNTTAKKKYHTGYIAGVFDLYHIGHLNMFKRAKEQCDYLIVGIVTDEGVRKYKEVEPFVPFEERVEMVKSCRYVDEVVAIPPTYRDTIDAWKLHHFDVQFSGSDYINDDTWIANKEFLNKHGADLVFFSYTQSTSSTKLKKLIEQKLI